ncbi:hypothetical protein EDD15DRAFT_2195215 [Pisolithus albus]|nr:hypothetical protein EDD15DRAFT_2195215 [Pisolithus albus]
MPRMSVLLTDTAVTLQGGLVWSGGTTGGSGHWCLESGYRYRVANITSDRVDSRQSGVWTPYTSMGSVEKEGIECKSRNEGWYGAGAELSFCGKVVSNIVGICVTRCDRRVSRNESKLELCGGRGGDIMQPAIQKPGWEG